MAENETVVTAAPAAAVVETAAPVVEQVTVETPVVETAAVETKKERLTPVKITERAGERAKEIYKRMAGKAAEVAPVETTEAAPTARFVTEADGRVRDTKTGFYASKETVAAFEAAAQEKPVAEATPPAEVVLPKGDVTPISPKQETKEAATAASLFEVEVQEDHPIRQMGRDKIKVTDPHDARIVQALLKGTYARVKEAEALRQQLAEASAREDELNEKLLHLDAGAAAEIAFKKTPEYLEAVRDYKKFKELEEVGSLEAGRAEKYWEATVSRLFEAYRGKEVESRTVELEQARDERNGRAWVTEAVGRVRQYPAEVQALPGFDTWVQGAVQAFNAELALGTLQGTLGREIPQGDPEALHKAFTSYLNNRLRLQPSFQAIARKWRQDKLAAASVKAQKEKESQAVATAQQTEQVKKGAVEEFKKEIVTTRQAAPPHPLGALTHGARMPAGSTLDNTSNPAKAANQFALQRNSNDRAAARAAKYLGGGGGKR